MPMMYPEEFIIRTVKQYEAGTPIKELSQSLNVASSTIYHWVKIYKTIPRKKGEYTPAGYQRLIDHEQKLERQLEVIHLSGCIDLISPHKRLFVLEDIRENHPEYTVYELCEALEVPRGTIYNHIKRRADRSQREAENEQIKRKIRTIFDKSKAFSNLLKENGITQSLSMPGQPLDNAVAESFFSAFKKEEAYRTDYVSERHFIESVTKYIDFYNNARPHKTNRYKTPTEFEENVIPACKGLFKLPFLF